MNRWKKPLLINGIMLAGLLLYTLATDGFTSDGPFGRFAAVGLLLLLLAPVNFVAGLVRWRNADGPVYLLLSGLLLLIGFSVCTVQ